MGDVHLQLSDWRKLLPSNDKLPREQVCSSHRSRNSRTPLLLREDCYSSPQRYTQHLICLWRPSKRREKLSPTCKAQMNHPSPYPIIILAKFPAAASLPPKPDSPSSSAGGCWQKMIYLPSLLFIFV